VPRSLAPSWFAAYVALMLALHFGWPVYQWNLGMSRWWGLPFALAGFVLVVASARRFSKVTTLRPQETPKSFVTDGFYRLSRNPMYTGMLLSLVGAFIMLGSLTPIVALPLFWWWIGRHFIAHEERVMEQQFGEQYLAYKRRVRRWI
jgi:protein-S-isoprenylcysteine O-methyltransferase Ste14